MNQPPGQPPGGPPYPGQPGSYPQPQGAQGPGAPAPAKAHQGTQLMPNAPMNPAAGPAQGQGRVPMGAAPGVAPMPAPQPGFPSPAAQAQPPPGYGPLPGYPAGPQGYGAQPMAYGAPAPGYPGAQPIQPYAPPYYGAIQQDLAQAGVALGVTPGTSRPRVRNAIMTLLLPLILYFGGMAAAIVGIAVGVAADSAILVSLCASLGGLIVLGASVVAFVALARMIGELTNVTRSQNLAWWMMLIPFFNLYVMLIVIPAEMTRAKQMLRVQEPTRSIFLYWLVSLYAFAADLNDVARAMPA